MPRGSAAVAAFLDREAATAVVTRYATALDARDWAAYHALFTSQIAIDYGAIGSLVAAVTADEWTNRCKALEGFDATAHRLSNIAALIDGDRAAVTSLVDAAHFITVGGQDGQCVMADLIGRYTHSLVREDGWKIAGVTLSLVGYPAGKAAFENGLAAARANFAERISR